jgi:hypothetical protein
MIYTLVNNNKDLLVELEGGLILLYDCYFIPEQKDLLRLMQYIKNNGLKHKVITSQYMLKKLVKDFKDKKIIIPKQRTI